MKSCDVLFFCSSAGEFEQAKPIAKRLQDSAKTICFCFFSQSAVVFYEKRGETFPYFLAPLDSFYIWQRIFKALNPKLVLVIRHELWPAFIFTASAYAPMYLVNAVSHRARINLVTRMLLKKFRKIFCIDEHTQKNFQKYLRGVECIHTGDSKYDRVMERVSESQALPPDKGISQLKQLVLGRPTLLIGSAWQQDVSNLMRALELSQASKTFFIVIAPHDTNSESVAAIIKSLAGFSAHIVLWSDLSTKHQANILVVDRLGILAELYQCADLALIGGAFHHRVHNILEAAAYDTYIACGPKMSTAPEAVSFADQGVLTVCQDDRDLSRWIDLFLHSPHLLKRPKVSLIALTGASDIILKKIREDEVLVR
jgi:3-deoxy-D-manno-octulosonic-acid transferase